MVGLKCLKVNVKNKVDLLIASFKIFIHSLKGDYMNKKKILLGAAFTGLMLGSTVYANETTAQGPEGQCHGINSCKGQSACGVQGSHGCNGHNECKGKGWLKMTEKECKEKGGTFKEK